MTRHRERAHFDITWNFNLAKPQDPAWTGIDEFIDHARTELRTMFRTSRNAALNVTTREYAGNRGMLRFIWSVDLHDPDPSREAGMLAQWAQEQLHDNDGFTTRLSVEQILPRRPDTDRGVAPEHTFPESVPS